MKKIKKILYASLLLSSCASSNNVATNINTLPSKAVIQTKPLETTSTPPSVIAQTGNPSQQDNVNITKYQKNPLASPLLSFKELETKKKYKLLADALKEPQNVFRLKIGDYESGFDVLNLTANIGELYNLQELEIDGYYESIPKEIGKLIQLQKVYINLPNLKKELPQEIINWKNLKKLHIENTMTTNTTILNWSSISLLKSVEECRIEGKGIKSFPKNFKNLVNIKKLELMYLGVSEINELSNLASLSDLYLTGCENLTVLPSLKNCLKLISIDLNGSKIVKSFFTDIHKDQMKYLRIIDCPNLFIPKNFFSDYRNIENLLISNCPKIEVPEKLIITKNPTNPTTYSAKSDQQIYFRFLKGETQYENEFFIKSKGIALPNEANLCKNKSLIKKIETINIDNDFHKLYKELHLYPNLESIEINNVVDEVSLGDYIGPNLPQVKYLKVWNNHPKNHNFEKLISACTGLENLILYDAIEQFPVSMWNLKQLKSLEIFTTENHKDFKFILPKEIGNLSNLMQLHLMFENLYVPLKTVSIDPALHNLVNLKELIIIMNEYKKTKSFTYPDGIEKLVNLKKLVLNTVTQKPRGIEKLTNLKADIDIY